MTTLRDGEALGAFARDMVSAALWEAVDRETVQGCVLIKGAALAQQLYADGTERPYGDVDLLISEADVEPVVALLERRGFSAQYAIEDTLGARRMHASTYIASDTGREVDLHITLPGVRCAPAQLWSRLRDHVRIVEIAGQPTRVLDPVASALLVATHAAAHGPGSQRPLEDLDRALRLWPEAVWHAAAELADDVDALGALGLGLSLTEAGRRLARSLDVAPVTSTQDVLSWTGAPWGAYVLNGLRTGNLRSRVALVGRVVLPPPRSVRMGSRFARRGRRALIVSYLIRPARLLVRAPAAVRAWRAAARKAKSGVRADWRA